MADRKNNEVDAEVEVSQDWETRSVRLIKRGDIIVLRDGTEEVVREVQVVLGMANGSNQAFEPSERVSIVPPEELPELP